MGYDTSGVGGVTVTCPHTGEKFMGSDLASAWAMARLCSPNCEGTLNTGNISTLTGEQSDQIGSQVWMNANPEGKTIDITTEQKLALSGGGSAEYAAGWLGTYARSIPGDIVVNPAINQIQKYPIGIGTAEVWKNLPLLVPPTYNEVNGRLISGSIAYNNPGSRPGGESEPAYATGLNTDALLNSGETIGSQNRAGVGTTGVGGVSGILDKITAVPIALIAIIGVGLLLIFMMGKGLGSAVK